MTKKRALKKPDPKKYYVDLNKARNQQQRQVMEKINELGVCPFCPEHIGNFEVNPALKRNSSWMLTTNRWPYDHTKHHFLLILNRHAETLNDLSGEEFMHLLELIQWAEAEYQLANGGLAFRFGELAKTGASVGHLHAHLIMPDPERPEGEVVKFRIS